MGKESNMAFSFFNQNWGEATRALTTRVQKRTASEITSIVDAAQKVLSPSKPVFASSLDPGITVYLTICKSYCSSVPFLIVHHPISRISWAPLSSSLCHHLHSQPPPLPAYEYLFFWSLMFWYHSFLGCCFPTSFVLIPLSAIFFPLPIFIKGLLFCSLLFLFLLSCYLLVWQPACWGAISNLLIVLYL